MTDWRDRLVDTALHELHGQRPPDLSARVLAALGAAPVAPLPQLRTHRRRPWARVAGLAAAALLCGFVAVWLVGRQRVVAPVGPRIAIGIDVQAGRLELVEAGASRVVAALQPVPAAFAVAPGNQLHAPVTATFQLESFGRLVAAEHTVLEVRAMEFTRQHGIVAVSSLTLGVVAGIVTLQAFSRTQVANAGEELRMEAPRGEAVAMAQENQRLAQRLRELEQQNEALRTQLVQREVAPPAAAPEAAPAPAPDQAPAAPVAAALAFSDPRFADLLARIDWSKVGSVSHEMGPLLARLAAALEKEGAELPMDLAVEVQKLNTQLLEPVKAMLEAGVPGFGPNGSYTHPLIAANGMAATLVAAGQPLSPAQQRQIDGLVRAFAAEQQAISDAAHDLPLEQLLAETEMKERFYHDVGGMLAPAQQAALYPQGASAFEGTSLFSTGVLMRAHAEPVAAKDAADFARIVGNKVGEHLGLDEAGVARVRAVVARHAANPELWQERAAPVETSQAHFLRAGRTRAAMRSQIEWMRALQREAGLTPEQAAKLAKSTRVLVPLPR